MIDDPELRALFKAESEEHLQTLETGLLRLEAEPRDSAVLEELFRSAHSLKGAARMLGVGAVETLAHHFEDELGAARRGHLTMSSANADRLYHGLDAMRRLVKEASDGEPARVDMPRLLAELRGEALPVTPTREDSPPDGDAPREGDDGADTLRQDRTVPDSGLSEITRSEGSADVMRFPVPPALDPVPSSGGMAHRGPILKPIEDVQVTAAPRSLPEAPSDEPIPAVDEYPLLNEPYAAMDGPRALLSPASFKIETIRVEPQKLDALMTLAGEMTVTTTRVARAMDLVGDLMGLWEEWGRDATAPTALSDNVSNDAAQGLRKQLARSHAREVERLERLGSLLGRLEQTGDEGITRLALVADELDDAIRGLRLLPFSTLFNLFPRLVRDLSREQEKEVRLIVEGGAVTADKHLLEAMKDPLMHMLRNAIDHGVEPPEERMRQGKPRMATLRLRAYQTTTSVVIDIADDGRGLDEEAIRHSALHKRLRGAAELAALPVEEVRMLIFAPGFSTRPLITDVSGRGVGLDVVRTNIERLKGTIAVESMPGHGCTFRLEAPITLATTRVLLVRVARWSYALPVESIQETSLVSPQDVFTLEGRPTLRREGKPVPVARLSDLLELPAEQKAIDAGMANREQGMPQPQPCIFLALGMARLALFVDALLDVQEVVLKPFGGLLQRVRNVSGATILSTGEICMVLNPRDLIQSARKGQTLQVETKPGEEVERKKVLLLAEDSITTRTQEKRILEAAGYEVVTAVDGADAFSKLGSRLFDAVVSDIEMPNMSGLALTARIREDAKYKELPILLVTSLASDEDRRRGTEVGANAYIIKGVFEQTVLLDTLRRLV